MRPEKCSSIAKSVEPSSRGLEQGPNALEDKGNAIAPHHVPRWHDACHLGGERAVRAGHMQPESLALSNRPSMLLTVEFQRGNPLASVERLHTVSASATMLTSTRHVIARALVVRVNLASFISGP